MPAAAPSPGHQQLGSFLVPASVDCPPAHLAWETLARKDPAEAPADGGATEGPSLGSDPPGGTQPTQQHVPWGVSEQRGTACVSRGSGVLRPGHRPTLTRTRRHSRQLDLYRGCRRGAWQRFTKRALTHVFTQTIQNCSVAPPHRERVRGFRTAFLSSAPLADLWLAGKRHRCHGGVRYGPGRRLHLHPKGPNSYSAYKS